MNFSRSNLLRNAIVVIIIFTLLSSMALITVNEVTDQSISTIDSDVHNFQHPERLLPSHHTSLLVSCFVAFITISALFMLTKLDLVAIRIHFRSTVPITLKHLLLRPMKFRTTFVIHFPGL